MNDLIRWKPNILNVDEDGKLIQNFYNDILELPSSSSSSTLTNSTTITTTNQHRNRHQQYNRRSSQYYQNHINNKEQKQLIKFNRNQFFKAAIEDNVNDLKSMALNSETINECDDFGWTALMMSACAGSYNVFQYLLNLHANINCSDKKGNTIRSLAKQKNHQHILNILNEYDVALEKQQTEQLNTYAEKSYSYVRAKEEQQHHQMKNNKKLKIEKFYCKCCEQEFQETTQKQHETSTLHQFNQRDSVYKFSRRYFIPDSNKGFQMLINLGWDRESGLGPHKEGKLFPMKTVLRKYRNGLGIKQESAKITHFGPYDLRAIKKQNNQQMKYKTKKDIQRDLNRDRQKEFLLRNELS